MAKLITPRLAVTVLEGDDEVEYTVQTDNRDAVRFDMLRGRKGFPGMDEAPILWMSVLAWSALNRAGKIGADVEKAIAEQFLAVVPVDADDNEIAGDIAAQSPTVDPTQPDR